MELMDLLQSRRAFREYDDQPLTSEELQPILLAAETSPVGLGKYRNHRLTVIQDPKVLKQIQNIYQAPTLIVVSSPDPGQLEFIDAGIIVHNMELAAENEGLAANYNMACLAPGIAAENGNSSGDDALFCDYFGSYQGKTDAARS